MRTLGIALAVLLTLVAAAVAVVPRLIDWNRYRPEIAARIEAALGRHVEINGDLSLRLVPVPALAVEGVRLANVQGAAAPDMIAVEALRLELAPAALLGGTVRIRSLTLVQPTIHLQTFPDGRGNWEFRSAAAPPAEAPVRPASQDGGGIDLQVEKLVVENGTVLFQRPEAEAVRVDGVDATVSAAGVDGPFQAQGDATWQGVRLDYELSTGRVAGNGAAPVSAALRLPEKRAEAKLSGQVVVTDAPRLRGKLGISAGNLSEILALLPQSGTPTPGVDKPIALEGVVEASADQLDLNDMALRLGDTEGKGALGVKWRDRPAVDLALVFSRIDLDALTAADRPATAPAGGGGPSADQAGGIAGSSFAVPGNLDIRADIAAEVLLYRGAIVRQAKLEASLDHGVVAVRRASALLPGGSDISIAGTLRDADRQLAVDGSVEMSSDNLRAVLQWLGVAVARVPADRLRKFSGDGKLRGSLDELVVSDLDLRLDTSRLRGAANVRLAGRPAIGANLVVDNVNVDAYLPAAERPPAAAAGEAVPPATGESASQRAGVIDAFDANLKLRIEALTVNDVSVRDVLLDGSLLAGDLTLRQVTVGDFGGAPARLSGAVANLATGPVTVRDLSYDLRTRQPAKILRLLGIQPGFDPSRLGAIAVQGTAEGPLTELRVSGRLELAGGELSLDGLVDAGGAVPAFGFDINAGHPDVVALMRSFLPDYRPAARLGRAAVAARLEGRGTALTIEDLRLVVGNAEVTGTATIDVSSGKPALTVQLDLGDVVVDDFLPPPRAAFLQRSPGDWLVTPATPQPVASLVGGPSARPTPAAAATPPWSREPLDLAWFGSFSAGASLTARSVAYGRQRLEGVKTALTVADDLATLESLSATLFGGTLSMDGRLGRDGAAAATLTITDARLRQALSASAGIDVAAGRLTGKGSFTTRGPSPFDMASNLAGSGEVAVRDGVVHGFDLADVSRRLDSIENVGSLLALLQAGMGGGQTRFSSLTGTFVAESGNLVSRDIALQAEAGQGQGTATVNLPAYSLEARLAFTLAAHPGMPPFALRLDGPLDNPRRAFEADELQAWLIRKGVGRLLKRQDGAAGKVIDRLLGGGQTSQPPPAQAPTQPAPAQKPGVEDVLKGLLQELGR